MSRHRCQLLVPRCPRVATLVTLLAAVLTGCASLGGLEPPQVTLANLAVTEATLFETTLQATVRITNTNPQPLIADGLALKLYLGGLKVGTGTSGEHAEIPRLASATVPVTIHVSNVALVTRLKPILDAGAADYAMKGKLYLVRSWGRSRLRLASTGRIDLRTAPEPPAGGGDR